MTSHDGAATNLKVAPQLRVPPDTGFKIGGILGERMEANVRNWLLAAPDANPAMLQIFRDRDRPPKRDLVPWAGEFPGKYLISATQALRLTRDARLREYLVAFVKQLVAAQDRDGYLGPFPRSERLLGKGLWDLWGHYHCMLGLVRWYQLTGDREALGAARRAADLTCQTFLDGDRRVVQAGSEEMNQSLAHVLCLLHEEGGEERYLRLAREIERDWETPPSGDYVRTALVGKAFFQCPKPRWESLHAIQAIAELYFITGDPKYRRAYEQIWWSIAEGDRHNTGGFSSGEQATGNPYDPRPIETCCTIAWMAVTVDMLRLTGDSRAADELELSTFNAVLGAQGATGRWWTYNTPMDGQRKASAHDIVFQARAGSPELNCCSVNGPRGLGVLSEWAAMQAPDGVVLNYYGPSTLALPLPSGGRVRLTQETEYPRQPRVLLCVEPDAERRFHLRLRIPGWSDRTRVLVAGQEQPVPAPGRYLDLDRAWKPGESVELTFDFSSWFWPGERECEGKASIYRGPLLLAFDPRFNNGELAALPALDAASLKLEPVEPTGHPAPLLLARCSSAKGGQIRLCDFASAGAAGNVYASWLPVRGVTPRPFSRESPFRCVRP